MTIWDELKYFKKTEFDCRCGCGQNEMEPDFLKKLDDLRGRFDFPFIVTSGYRCPSYNAQVSSTGATGPHTTGRAVDLALFGRKAFNLMRHWTLGGWGTGIGLKQHGPHDKRFIHLDDISADDNRFRPTVWTY